MSEVKQAVFNPVDMLAVIEKVREPLQLVKHHKGYYGIGNDKVGMDSSLEIVGQLAAIYPEWLGDKTFLQTHKVRFPYIAGAMANGIATADLVIAMAKAGMLGFFGAGGLSPKVIEENIIKVKAALDPAQLSFGFNLIHTPDAPMLEEATVDLYLKYKVNRISASAYMRLTPSVVRYACKGLSVDAQGQIKRQNYVFAKVSQPEVARQFLLPAPQKMLQALVEQKQLTAEEAHLASKIALAEDITAESDSGGHTDNRPLGALLPLLLQEKQTVMSQHAYAHPIRIGAAGGLGTPLSVASAFAMGADYVLTGTINEASLESGLSLPGKQLLAKAEMADVMMAPAADMFERNVKVQVLKRGTLFGPRAKQLYEIYSQCSSIQSIPAEIKQKIEQDVFKDTLENIWQQTQTFFNERDPAVLQKAQNNPKQQMALAFRWYLGHASRWSISGEIGREVDYQIWCGPAMGAFNEWVKGSFLEPLENRQVTQIALNLLEGAAVATRIQQLRSFGVHFPNHYFIFKPRRLA